MKRSIIAVTALIVSTGAFAWDVSVGLSLSGGYFINRMTTSNSGLGVSSDLTNTSLPFRAEAYLDAQYFRLGAGFLIAVLGHQLQTTTAGGTTTTITDTDTGTKGYLALSFYLKYPFSLGQFLLYPLLGVESDVNILDLSANGSDLRAGMTSQQLGNEDQIWVKAGMGAQLALWTWGYLRSELVLSWKVPNSSENALVENAQSSGFDPTLFSLRPDLSFAVGFKL